MVSHLFMILSHVTWDPDTRPEDGTLRAVEDIEVNQVRVYVKGKSHDPYKEDIYYQTEGYRLPTRGGTGVHVTKGRKDEGGS